ncbi:hypothetical protein BDV59DRAFT_175038 [Aspergillus ambiguus]|uniref:uncharacterized protein n=1 Tax=Aspergillus ambiguus TaxID=176160 RepID=UPI003CCD4C9B
MRAPSHHFDTCSSALAAYDGIIPGTEKSEAVPKHYLLFVTISPSQNKGVYEGHFKGLIGPRNQARLMRAEGRLAAALGYGVLVVRLIFCY